MGLLVPNNFSKRRLVTRLTRLPPQSAGCHASYAPLRVENNRHLLVARLYRPWNCGSGGGIVNTTVGIVKDSPNYISLIISCGTTLGWCDRVECDSRRVILVV